ncbi:polysaccharide deacetylase family protein [Desulfothermobacter acidiphilus]|uniref:polysaccharide deacetylase family protein n=1 Tax=Desulfothermobacter acidiphilus TaxID=1938353 RepID=UPI003F89A247
MAVIVKGPEGKKAIALTFDDGPDPYYTPQLLKCLDRFEARATFFPLASKARRYPELIRAIVEAGHEVGSHGMYHFPLLLRSPRGARAEIGQSMAVIAEIAGCPVRFFRPPWGRYRISLLPVAAELGVDMVLWSLDSLDWLWGVNPEVIATRLGRAAAGDIVLCHDGSFLPHRARTILQVLPFALKQMRERGLSPVPLSDLMEGR